MSELLAALRHACSGDDPDNNPLDWFSALLTECRDCQLAEHTEDPEAFNYALLECEGLLSRLRTRVATTGGTL